MILNVLSFFSSLRGSFEIPMSYKIIMTMDVVRDVPSPLRFRDTFIHLYINYIKITCENNKESSLHPIATS